MSTTTKPSDDKIISFNQLGTSKAEQSAAISSVLKNDFDIKVKPNIRTPFTGDAQISVRGKNVTVPGACNGGHNKLNMRCTDHIHPTDGLAIGVLSSKKN